MNAASTISKTPITSLALNSVRNSKLSLETRTWFWPTIKEQPARTEREGGKHDIFVAPICLLRYSRAEFDQNKNKGMVHFIILTFEPRSKIIARNDEGKGDRDRLRWKHARTQSIFTEELFIDTFLNDEQRQKLQYFQATPTNMLLKKWTELIPVLLYVFWRWKSLPPIITWLIDWLLLDCTLLLESLASVANATGNFILVFLTFRLIGASSSKPLSTVALQVSASDNSRMPAISAASFI